MHEMQTIAFDDRRSRVSVTQLRCANADEWIKVLLGVETLEHPRNMSQFLRGFDAAFPKLLWPLV